MWAILGVLAAALCFSTTGTARALAHVDASPVAVGAARILIGGAVLGAVALLGHLGRHRPRVGVRPGRHGSPTRRSWGLVAIGACGVLAYQPAFFLGTEMNGVAIGTVVALGSAPIATGVGEAVLTRKAPTGRWLMATGLAILGVVLVSGLVGPGQSGAVTPLGLLASVGAGASYAVYTMSGKALLTRGWNSRDTMGATFGVAAVLSLPILLLAGSSWLATPAGLALAGWLGLVTTALAYTLFGWGLARLPATTVSTLTLAEPLSATLLGIVVLGEQLTALSTVGIAIIAAGLVLLALPNRQNSPDVPATL